MLARPPWLALAFGISCALAALDGLPARASTLCFDDPREVLGRAGHSCCLGGALDATTASACGPRRYSCTFEERCELALAGSSTVRVVDATSATAITTTALLWAPHRCCADGTLVVRSTRDVTPFSPQPLECRLVPGCRVELELASKYTVHTPPELAVADMPWARADWEMFLVCTRDGGRDLETCAEEWLLPDCAAAICDLAYRDRLIPWLEKIVAPAPQPGGSIGPTPTPGPDTPAATLFTAQAAACCAAGSIQPGPFYLGGALHAVACEYDPGCAPHEGDMLYFGDATLLVAKTGAWSQIPAMCEAELAARDGMVAALEDDVAAAEARAIDLRATLQRELAECRLAFDTLKASQGACTATGAPVATDDHLVVEGDSALVDLLANDQAAGAEVIGLSPPRHGIAVWQPDGLMTYFPNPGFSGTETLYYQVRDAHGRIETAAVEVAVR